MADYQKMYAILCGAVDDALMGLEQGSSAGWHRAPSPAGAGARGGDLSGDQYVRGTARRYEPDRAAARCSGCLGAIEKTGSRLLPAPEIISVLLFFRDADADAVELHTLIDIDEQVLCTARARASARGPAGPDSRG